MSEYDEDQTGGLEHGTNPEKPSPARPSSNTSRDDRAYEDANEVCPKIKCHGSAPLVDKEQVADHHWHE